MTEITLYTETLGSYLESFERKLAAEIETNYSEAKILLLGNALEEHAIALASKAGGSTFEIDDKPFDTDVKLRPAPNAFLNERHFPTSESRASYQVAWIIFKYKCKGDANLLRLVPYRSFRSIYLEHEARVDNGEFWLYIPTQLTTTSIPDTIAQQTMQNRDIILSSVKHNLAELTANFSAYRDQIKGSILIVLNDRLKKAKEQEILKRRLLD